MQALSSFLWAIDPALWAIESSPRLMPSLDDWQAQIIRDESRDIIACTSRQAGKSTIISKKACHKAIYSPGSFTLVAAAVGRQADEIFAKIRFTLRNCPPKVKIVVESKREIILSTGSRIVCVPGKAENIAGFSAPDLIIIDEACYASDKLFNVMSPMRATNNGQMILISTPYIKRGFFYEIWNNGAGWKKYHVTANDIPRISKEFLEKELQRLGPWWFASQYMGEFQDAEDAVFKAHWIEAAFSNNLSPLFTKTSMQVATEEHIPSLMERMA